jgi:outer membrane cobalamin receptor
MRKIRYAIFILFLITPLFANTEINNESDLDKIRVTLEVEKAPLREAIRELVTQTKLQIVYSDALVHGIEVSCACKNVTLRQALDMLLEGTRLAYKVMKDGQIVIVKYDPEKKVNVKGFVRDEKSGETLPYANISLVGKNRGTASNTNGYFVLVNVPSGPYTLRVRYIGYKTLDVPLFAFETIEPLDIRMKSQAVQGEEVLVTAENLQTMEVSENPAQIRLSPRQIRSLPSVGEVDIFRSLQLLPGISGVNDGSSGLYIRGGTPAQNLVLFDGMTIYYVDHFFGFISAFNTEAVKDVRVFKGGFPASFGGRTSSVVELTGKSGSFDNFNVSGSMNLLSGSGVVQVPIGGKGAWLLSFRRSYTDFIKSGLYNKIYESITGQNKSGEADTQSQQNPVPGGGPGGRFAPRVETATPDFYYYDLNSKLSYALSKNDIFSLSFYSGNDNLDQTQEAGNVRFRRNPNIGNRQINRITFEDQTRWGNIGSSGKWSRVWSDRLYSNLLAAYSQYRSESIRGIDAGTEDPNAIRRNFSSTEENQIRDFTLRLDTEWQLDKSHRLELGAWFSRTNVQVNFTANDTLQILRRDDDALQSAFYLQDRWQVFKPLELTLGLRTTNYDLTQKNYLEPRAAFRLALNKNLRLKGAWGQYYQFITRVVNEDVLRGNRDFWLLANERLDPGYAEHSILGLSYETGDYLFEVEAYYKDLDGVAEFSQRFRRGPEDRPEDLFFLGTGVAKGIEFLAQKKFGRLNGWASYTLAKVDYTISAFNDGGPYPADQDRRHEVKLVGNYKLGKWNFAATWVYASGSPYTAPETQYAIDLLDGQSRSYIHVGDKNSYRLPAYHRLDVSLSRQFQTHSLLFDLGLSVFNVYNRANVWFREYLLDTSPVIVRDVTTLGFTPTVTLRVGLK